MKSALKFPALAGLVAAAALTATLATAQAADLVVVDAAGIDLKAGQKVDGSQALPLAAGQRVTLVAEDGTIVKLRGPYDAAPAPETAAKANGVVSSLRDMIAQKAAGTATLGVVRSGETAKEVPEPWLVDVSKTGNRCLQPNTQAVFWRPDVAAPAPFEITPADRSWSAKDTWPAASEKLAMPATLALRDGEVYQVEMNGKTASITIHVMPASLGRDQMKAAWMAEKGCDAQAAALVKIVQ